MTNVAFPTEDYRTVAVLRIAPWNLNPLRLVSFVEMIEFYKQYFDFEMHFIDHWKRRFAQRERERGPFDPLSEEERVLNLVEGW